MPRKFYFYHIISQTNKQIALRKQKVSNTNGERERVLTCDRRGVPTSRATQNQCLREKTTEQGWVMKRGVLEEWEGMRLRETVKTQFEEWEWKGNQVWRVRVRDCEKTRSVWVWVCLSDLFECV